MKQNEISASPLSLEGFVVTPKGVLLPALCHARATLESLLSKLKRTPPHKKLM